MKVETLELASIMKVVTDFYLFIWDLTMAGSCINMCYSLDLQDKIKHARVIFLIHYKRELTQADI